jgi:hypothetical protein
MIQCHRDLGDRTRTRCHCGGGLSGTNNDLRRMTSDVHDAVKRQSLPRLDHALTADATRRERQASLKSDTVFWACVTLGRCRWSTSSL